MLKRQLGGAIEKSLPHDVRLFLSVAGAIYQCMTCVRDKLRAEARERISITPGIAEPWEFRL
jgi:hypothetical protein